MDELVHRVCQFIAERENLSRDCLKCPAQIETNYGLGVRDCRLMAEELIEMIRSADGEQK